MGFFSSDQPKTSHKVPESPKEAPKPPSFFGPRGSLPRSEFREKLRNAPYEIPGSSEWMTYEEREALEKKFGYEKYLSDISPDDVRRLIKEDFQQAKSQAKTQAERDEIDRTIRWMKKHLLGDL